VRIFIFILLWCCASLSAEAAEVALEKVQTETGVAALERGAEALITDCHSCHTLKYIRYRDLVTLGIAKEKVEAWRGDAPLDSALTSQMPDDAALQSFGKVPPDLSLMVSAREGGAGYVYSYLTGYYNMADGATSNRVYPETRMPDVLGLSGVTDAAQRATAQERARDIVSFLAWAADPHGEERRTLGYYVIAYLLVLTALLYLAKNQVWAELK
jgi:ubiquinol-cytochrome c reductase cytochrome c1 subunit